MSQPLLDKLILSEEDASPAELWPRWPQPTSQTGPFYHFSQGDKRVESSWFTSSRGLQKGS